MRWLTVMLTVVALLLGASGSVSAAANEGFGSPEDAVRAYVAGVAAADTDLILDASAIDEMADGFRFDVAVDRLGAFMPTQQLGPAEYPLFAEIDRAAQAAQTLRWAQMLVYSLLTDEELDAGPIVPVDEAWATGFVRQVDPDRLAGLEVLDVRFPDPDLEHDERYVEVLSAQAKTMGADELTERVALLTLEGRSYMVGFTLARYGDGWKVASQDSPLAGTSALGTAVPTTADEFELRTSGG